MDPKVVAQTAETFKIACSLYPEVFDLDKSLCKSYFRQYGKVMRLIFKPKQRVIVVEYTNKNDYLNALSGSSEYEGQSFKVEPFEPGVPPPAKSQGDFATTKKKAREKIVHKHKLTYLSSDKVTKKHNVSYIDNDEVNEELAAMGGYKNNKDIIDLTIEKTPSQPQQKPKRAPKLNRIWKKEETPNKKPFEKPRKVITVKKKQLVHTLAEKKVKEKVKMLTADQLELLKVIKTQALTVDEKYKVLDARDKLLRLDIKTPRLKSSPTVGTCPDMCPEKERLLREIQHQVSLYEQDRTGRHCMDHSKAVKQYSRSSADQESPLPHELRPVSVLRLTMAYLMHNIMNLSESDQEVNIGEWFHFLWDRTRGIRKDITQQALCCQGSVELIEQCARFHIHCSARLMGEDPSVFDQKINTENLTKCLQTLKYMYHDLELKGENCPNEAEFRAYIILLNLSDGNFMWEVQKLRREIQKSPEVKFALQIYSAFDKRNYVKFFKLIKSTTYLNSCVLMRYFVQVRVQAIETLIKCFTPPKSISFYPVQELTNSLFFDDSETTIDFMKTYGIGVNKNGTSFMIERTTFSRPEYPYVLDRSRGVEGKRVSSIGIIVNGKEMSPESYMQMQSHEVHNSFNKDGFLIQDEIFNEIELSIEERLLDEPDSRESTPERKNIVTNIFAPKIQSGITLKRTVSPSIFAQPKPEKNIFIQSKKEDFAAQSKLSTGNIFIPVTSNPTNIFVQNKPEPVNIFAQPKAEAMQVTQDASIFAAVSGKKTISDIFKTKDEVDAAKTKDNIFASSVTGEVKGAVNIFSQKNTGTEEVGVLGKAKNEGNIFKTNIFGANHPNRDPRTQPSKIAFGVPGTTLPSESQKNIFVPKEPQASTGSPKKGGFTFVLNRPPKTEVPNIFATGFKLQASSKDQTEREIQKNEAEIEVLEQERLRLQEEIRKETAKEEQEKREQEEFERRNEEIRRKNEEAAERRKLETERLIREEFERKKREKQESIEREKRLEQERIEQEKRLEEERKQREEETKKKLAKLERQKKQEEKRKNMEIQKTVKSVITKMVEAVDLKIRQESLKRIRESMRRRSLLAVCKKWRSIVLRRVKKRKALDCNPTFFHRKSVTECARDLHSKSQDLALSNIKRYKYGRPLEIPVVNQQPIGQLKLFHLTYSALRRRLCELKEKWRQHIYWKVVISLPDIDEMIMGLHKLEETLNSYTNWQLDKYGKTAYIEHHKTVTYCVEKQQGFEVKSNDANAFVFIAKKFDDIMQRRVFENLKDFGVYVKLPLVLILEDTAQSEEYLHNLRKTGIVSDFVIYSCSLGSHVLPSIIDNGLIFLAKRVEKYPPLEMDTLQSFIRNNLCTEIWKTAGSYAKWNHEYNFCMRDPNIVINIYNEGLKILGKIVTDKKTKEHAKFPEVFYDYLPDKFPDFLPCDYRYFPTFWLASKYEEKLKLVIKNLRLPKFLEKWPPENETELLVSVSKYCTEVLKNPKDPLTRVLKLLKDGAEDADFNKIIWADAIQVIAQEKLKDQDLNLPKDFCSDAFSSFIVVYDVNLLNTYCTSEWFYRNNATIEGYKKIISSRLAEEVEIEYNLLKDSENRKRAWDTSYDPDDVFDVINKAENILKSPKNACLETKTQIQQLNRSIRDLEDSINVVKSMDKMKLFKRFIEH